MPGAIKADIMLHLVVGHPVEHFLIVARFPRAAAESPRKIGIIAIAADGIRIERHQFAGPQLAPARFLEPGIGALAGGEQPRLDKFTALADDFMIHDGEEIVLTHARTDGIANRRNGSFGTRHADLQAFYFLRGFYGANAKDFALAVMHLQTLGFQARALADASSDQARSFSIPLHACA